MKIKSIILVIVQVATIVFIFLTGKAYCSNYALMVFQLLGLALLIWTWINLRPGKFNIMPDAMKKASLVTSGPFRFIRHPMYLSLFMYFLPLVIEYYTWIRLAVLLVFTANMVIKMYYEEKLLQQKFIEYADYMKHSKRLIPFIY
jgi:protein-S-isoprenylcysteine O-methyltransferase Ste14